MPALTGKTAIVTGASSGIGHAIAASFLAEGATVFGLCRTIGRLPPGVTPISCDLRNPDRIAHAFEIFDAAAPQLDILVNNAGLAYLSRITDGKAAEWDEMWEVNVRALGLCCQHALPRFPATGGRIINLSSLSGHRVPPTGGFYAPTKFAVRALTDALRNELKLAGAPHQVATVSPGFVDTPLVDNYFRGRESELGAMKESMRMLDPGDIARAVLHIAGAPAHVEVGDIVLRSADQKV
ncbi:MAG: SDR family NAD(P)-dependent oxidoreductase [Akkermansiaceae bacterium]|nr:SDR family NAD(P)-dependent oxidoreductase [Akkermansiaceae bacterium]NNM30516.1 SDR family NAD(P)-dependent oxidoreductase [Akkermansiaceae bacterium]